jgi:hypothetical protein
MFYKAMSVFVRKHYGGSKASIFNAFMQIAIWTKAGLTAVAQFIRRIGLPLIDAGLIFLSFWIVKHLWSRYIRTDIEYENRLLIIEFAAYTVCYLLTAYYAGLYDRWYRKAGLIRSTLIATIVLLAGYALLPESLRFSRGILLFGALLAFIVISVQRWVLIKMNVLSDRNEAEEFPTTVIAGTEEEYESVVRLLRKSGQEQRVLGRVSAGTEDISSMGYWKKLPVLYNTVPFREIIYCEGNISFAGIIQSMTEMPKHVVVKVHASGSDSIVGSNSKDSSGEALTRENSFGLADPYNRRLKRLIDVITALAGLFLFPVQLLFVKKPVQFFGNCFKVLFAQKTWVGYATGGKDLPHIKSGILASNGVPHCLKQPFTPESLHRIDFWYARDYEPMNDLRLIRKSYRRLGGA